MNSRRTVEQKEQFDFSPIKILEVEISQPLPELSLRNDPGQPDYQRAFVLARFHSQPLGLIDLDLKTENATTGYLAAEIWDQFHERINAHRLQDGYPRVNGISPDGLKNNDQPKCLSERMDILQQAPLVSVIIATRDRVQSLAATMDSLLAVEYPNFEIVLVDNAPKTEETLDYYFQNIARFNQKNVNLRYVREEIPGLAVAHNRGLEEVKGTIIAFTDDDVIVDRYWLAEIVCGFRVAKDVGCVTGLVIPAELQTPAQLLFEQFGGFTKGFSQRVYDMGEYRPKDPLFPYTAGRFGTGANMAYKAEALRSIGGFDPALGVGTPALGADDLSTFYKIIDHGYQLVYQSAALAFHQHRRTYEGLRKQMYGYGVGLTAFLTKCVLDDPVSIFQLVPKIFSGILYAFDSKSEKNHHKPENYPRELDSIERKGMLYGPLAYLYSRWHYRKYRNFLPPQNPQERASLLSARNIERAQK